MKPAMRRLLGLLLLAGALALGVLLLRKTAEKAFREVLARNGVLGGTSAGAALMSNPMITGGTATATGEPSSTSTKLTVPMILISLSAEVKLAVVRIVAPGNTYPAGLAAAVRE